MGRGEIEDRDEQGKIKQKVSDDELRDAVEKHQPASTKAIAEEVGIHPNPTRQRLKRIDENDEGVIGDVVGNSFVWMRKEDS
jgi:hypothetical protein